MVGYLQGISENDVASLVKGLHFQKAKGGFTRTLAGICWHVLHIIITIIEFVAFTIDQVISLFLVKSLEKYKTSVIKKPQIVGIVIESKDAEAQLSAICKLLQWLSDTGVQHVSLYDVEGVLKQLKMILERKLNNLNPSIQIINSFMKSNGHIDITENAIMRVELLSSSDGKEGITRAARYLCEDALRKINTKGQLSELKLSVSDIDRGLEATGCAGPKPDLLLVFGFSRCLLGFPAWRIFFTEIMYMGKLKYLSLNSLVTALSQFSTKSQRYGK
eukprot:TRINITY_DN3241_c0_g1_i1.p1 TRINITY_DN3241_c0_g1~~TRINITY_DN3241_c0_g1_i1.p1  ORF type:complete len:275 (-),score=46.22 TRINITY_DN3241_c0_g1_i1:382-1206(-)